MNNSEKVYMLFVYVVKFTSGCTCLYSEHPSHSYFHKLERDLRNTGSFSNIRVIANQQPRQVNVLGEDIELQVLAYVRANPRVSTHHVGFEIGKLLGPYFYDGTLNGRRYLEFLINELPIMLDDIPLATRNHSILQQDGAPAHNAIVMKNYLNEHFENRWIRTNGIIKWPPRSPDLTPLDYFLWGHLKTIVYGNPPTNLIDLKQKIIVACNQLTKGQISSATNKEFLRRTEACLNYNGEQFEQFIR
ncbi:unnamed protein product [Macrosiphum euphorbiae]|uniref:Transposase n=1 Tax=Macrosiphum euphorbiae TaxID=13131 RepID=A0AAV0WUJ0_9HEMI|nr:unnamed protein product [Macrosiphum euphorbiae]